MNLKYCLLGPTVGVVGKFGVSKSYRMPFRSPDILLLGFLRKVWQIFESSLMRLSIMNSYFLNPIWFFSSKLLVFRYHRKLLFSIFSNNLFVKAIGL